MQMRRVCTLVTAIVDWVSRSDKWDIGAYPYVHFLIQRDTGLNVKEFRSAKGHRALLSGNILNHA